MTKHAHQYTCISLREYADRAESFGMSSDLDDRLDWIVASHSQNRDSCAVERSNFRTCDRLLTEQGVEHEIVRFGHWAVGWVEHILVHPAGREAVEGLVCDDYTILDDTDLSEVQADDESDAWEAYGRGDFCLTLARETGCDRAVDALSADDAFALWQAAGPQVEHDNEGPDLNVGLAASIVARSMCDTFADLVIVRRADDRAQKMQYTVYTGTHLRRDARYVISPAEYQRTHTGDDLTAPGVLVFADRQSMWRSLRMMGV